MLCPCHTLCPNALLSQFLPAAIPAGIAESDVLVTNR